MPLPAAPIALFALRTAAIAVTAYAIARNRYPAPRDQRGEDALDDTAEGLAFAHERDQARLAGKMTRTLRFGPSGPGVHLELAGIARLRWKRV